MSPLKVTMIICDRCDAHLRQVHQKESRLDLSIKYHDESQAWSLFRERKKLHLCPSCRTAFAEWLGARGDEIEGLRVDSGPEAVQELDAYADEDGDASGLDQAPEDEEPLQRVEAG